ncbi:MAG: outer membrane beta-barrel protein, partial [bacterium]
SIHAKEKENKKEEKTVETSETSINFPIAALFGSGTSSVEPRKSGFYFGIGGNYAIPTRMKYESDPDLNTDFERSSGLNLKAGYQTREFFSIELNFDKYASFGWEDNVPGYIRRTAYYVSEKPDMAFKGKADLASFMLTGKWSASFSRIFKPFFVFGFGFITVDHEIKKKWTFNDPVFKGQSGSITYKDDDTVICFKTGIGADFYVMKKVSLGFEASYIFAQNADLEEAVDTLEIGFVNFSLGTSYHFN